MRDFLIFGHNYIGDVLMLTPAIRALKLKFPESRVILVVSSGASPILKRNPDIWRIVDSGKIKGITGILGVLNLFLRLRRLKSKELGITKFYICINFLTSFKFSVIGYLLSKKQVGQDKGINNIFLHDKIRFEKNMHNVDKSLKFIEPFYISEKYFSRDYIYEASEKDVKNAENILKNSFNDYSRVESFKFVLFSPCSTRKSKEANPELFSLFADYLNAKGFYVVISGAKKNEETSKKIYEMIENKYMSINLTGLTDIFTLGGIIKRAALVVSVDNGVMHMSSAIKTPLIALFGSTDPAICGPITSDKTYVIDKKRECYHCFRKNCSGDGFGKKGIPDCMDFIILDDLKEGVKNLLK